MLDTRGVFHKKSDVSSASDSFATLVLYKFIYLLTYFSF